MGEDCYQESDQVLWERRQRDQEAGVVKCPRCRSEEWFPGASCWDCGWEAPAREEENADGI